MKSRLDTNAKVGALLRDLAAVQTSQPSKWGYKRAAQAILELDEPLESLLQPDGTLRKIPHVGPSSLRVIQEVLHSGRSDIVERAVGESTRAGDVARSRELRGNFLSRAQVAGGASRIEADRGLDEPAHYRGDLQMHSEYSDGRASIAEHRPRAASRAGLRVLRRHRSLVRLADRARRLDARISRKQHTEIDALNRRYQGPVPHPQGHRGQHPGRRPPRHDGRRSCGSSKWCSPRRIRSCAPATTRRGAW